MKPKITTKDWNFLMRTLVYALLFLAILHAFKPYYGEAPASTPEVEALALQAKEISPQEVGALITQSTKPTMLVVYASWCGYCKKTLPEIYTLWQEKKLARAQLLMVSVDQTVIPLAEYLLPHRLNETTGAPLVLKQDYMTSLSDILQPMGAGYKGSIPYIGFFAAGGKFVGEFRGAVSKNEIAAALAEIE